MDHLTLINSARELESLVSGKKSMLAYGAWRKRLPVCDIHAGAKIFFALDSGVGFVMGQALVKDAFSTQDFSRKKPKTLISANQSKLNFNDKEIGTWAKKNHILFVELAQACQLKPFAVNLGKLSRAKPLIPIGYLNQIRIS